jgi:peptidoglycan hydrolase CwlO-like protein
MNEKEVEDKLKGFQTDMDKLTKELEDAKKRVDSGQQLLDKHKQEMGEARKEIQDAVQAITKMKEEGDIGEKKYNELLGKLESMDGKLGSQSNSSGGGGTEDMLDAAGKSLTPEQKKAANEAYSKLKREEKQALFADEAEMKDFLNTAKLALPSIPKSLFGDEEENNTNAEPDKYKKLFGLAQNESSAVPAGRRGSASGFADASRRGDDEGQQSQSRMLAGGIIPKPQAVT